jgi:ABC-type multidrug transport system permease subunit
LLTGLIAGIGSWLLGGAFGLTSGFGGLYERVSRLTPNAYAVDMLFFHYYGARVGNLPSSILALTLFSVSLLALAFLTYRWRVLRQE